MVNEHNAKPLQDRLGAVQIKLEDWLSLLPQCLGIRPSDSPLSALNNIALHLSFYASQALLFRSLMSPATREARATPDSNLRRWFSTALMEFRSFASMMSTLTEESLEGFWVRHARSQLILCGNFLIYLFLLAYTAYDIESAYQLLESFHQSLQRLGTAKSEDTRLLLRPVRLRIDSFFTQASELLKRAGSAHSNSPITPM
ncbi:hypothetical protein BBP40_011298 [Aspergillus hancockii]|nr:hypothetical protein BBP40_011298 [Aspergillus hancockii]